MTSKSMVPRTSVALALLGCVLAGCGDDATPASRGRSIPAAAGCTNPTSPAREMAGLEPRQIAAAYGIDALWDAGFRGEGRRVAFIEPGTRIDERAFRDFSSCWGPFDLPREVVVGGGTPRNVGGEANFDPQTYLAIAPDTERVYLFSSEVGGFADYAPLVEAALDPANTEGRRVDAISISFGGCEHEWQTSDVEALEAQFRRAAELGVKVLVAGGDAGSVGYFPDPDRPGDFRCVGVPAPSVAPFGVQLDIAFPASSPWATAVGGTELAIDGTIPESGAPAGGVVTAEVVWKQTFRMDTGLFAGGGGLSRLFPITDAPWQQGLGLTGAVHRPDVAALAGSPKYPGGGIGTSGASPLVTAGMMVVDSFLVAHGVEPPGFLNPVLYDVARTDYARVFNDVTEGDNDIYDLGCCRAEPGYDLASGLGSIRFDQLAAVLRERTSRP